MFPVRYGLDLYILLRRNYVFKGLTGKTTTIGATVAMETCKHYKYIEVQFVVPCVGSYACLTKGVLFVLSKH
jgi:hypothetical protein